MHAACVVWNAAMFLASWLLHNQACKEPARLSDLSGQLVVVFEHQWLSLCAVPRRSRILWWWMRSWRPKNGNSDLKKNGRRTPDWKESLRSTKQNLQNGVLVRRTHFTIKSGFPCMLMQCGRSCEIDTNEIANMYMDGVQECTLNAIRCQFLCCLLY